MKNPLRVVNLPNLGNNWHEKESKNDLNPQSHQQKRLKTTNNIGRQTGGNAPFRNDKLRIRTNDAETVQNTLSPNSPVNQQPEMSVIFPNNQYKTSKKRQSMYIFREKTKLDSGQLENLYFNNFGKKLFQVAVDKEMQFMNLLTKMFPD